MRDPHADRLWGTTNVSTVRCLDEKLPDVGLHRSKSFWFNTAPTYRPCDPLVGDADADFCIIGGGIAGVSAAYHLKKIEPSARVILLEAEVMGFGASGRNAGQLIVSFGGGSLSDLVRRFGVGNMGDAYSYVSDGISLIEDLQIEEGFTCDYAATGCLKTGLKIEGDEQVDLSLKLFDKIGHGKHYTYLSQSEVEKELHSPYLGSALYDPRGGQFNPLKLVRGLREAALRRGAEICENSPVAGIDLDGQRIIVHTGCGSVRTGKVILATNAYSHQIQGLSHLKLHREQTPLMVKGVVTEPLSEVQWLKAGWPRRSGVNVLSQLFYSFAPTIDGRLLYVGGYYTSAPYDRSLAPEVEWRLKRPDHLAAFFPAMAGVRVAQTWGGPISITADWIPHIGASRDPRVVYACGCWGHGMAINLHNGRTLAELSLETTSASTEVFFVRRKKTTWPNRVLAGLLATSIIAKRRRGNRRRAAKLNPPIYFD